MYADAGARAIRSFPHFFFNNGYAELDYGVYSARDADAFLGPFSLGAETATPLVVATTHDPATPYAGARRLVRTLGHARLLTMRGDGHTAYGGQSHCIDRAVNRYLLTLHLPRAGTTCTQHVPFRP